jgi:cyclopropane fatty-acyl-phospholipid synthase-like methyltransferase
VKEAGIEDKVEEAHKHWSGLKAGGGFLELGCFSGSRFTFEPAESAGNYLGVELSQRAVKALNGKLIAHGLAHKARAKAVGLLRLDSRLQNGDKTAFPGSGMMHEATLSCGAAGPNLAELFFSRLV